jgi:hypothetical protein
MINFIPLPLNPKGNGHPLPSAYRLGEPQSQFGHYEEEKKKISSLCQKLNPDSSVVQIIA